MHNFVSILKHMQVYLLICIEEILEENIRKYET